MFNLELSVSTQSVSTKKQGMFITTFGVRENISVDTTTLTDLLTSKLYSTNQWKDGKCLNTNFIRMTGITIDIDQHVSIDEAKKLFEKYNYIIHTSTSHKEDIPNKNGIQDRFRVILPFDPAQYDIVNTEALASAVYAKVMSTYDFVDKACADPARKYFPFLNKQFPTLFELYVNDVGNYFALNMDDVKKQADSIAQAVLINAPKSGTAAIDDLYRLKLTDKFLLRDKKTWLKLGDFKPKTVAPFTEPVFCNVCDDINSQGDSAFVNFDYDGFPFVHCKHCNKTYKLSLLESFPELFYLGNTMWRIDTRGEISIDRCPAAYINHLDTDIKKKLDRELATKKGFSTSTFRLQRQVDGYAEEKRWELDEPNAQLHIFSAPRAVKIKDNDYINKYLLETFGKYVVFIKKWIAIWVYQNYRSLPLLVFNGTRNAGKSTFGEMLQNIYPGLVQEWKAKSENFTDYNEKKLLLVDEAEVDRKEQYTEIKSMTGSEYVPVNIKFMPKYKVRNNLNIIMTTNNDSPLYLTAKERPRNEAENQFFMYTFPDIDRKIKSNIKTDLADRIGWYVRTELRDIYEEWLASEDKVYCRYGIIAPITPLLEQQFNDARSSLDYNTDQVYNACLTGIEIKDRQGNLMNKLGPYELVNSAELQEIIDAMRLTSHNIKSIRERMQSHGYLAKGIRLTKDNLDAWQVIPREHLIKTRNPNGTTNISDGSSGDPEISAS